MSEERLLKRGKLAELEDEEKTILAKTRAHVQTIRNVFDRAENLLHMDLDMAMVIAKEMKELQNRYHQIDNEMQEIKKILGL